MIYENNILTPGQKLDIISRNSAEGVIIIDDSGTIEEWNDYMVSKTGYTREEITGKKIWTVQYNILPDEWKKKYTMQKLKSIWMNFLTGMADNEFVRKEGQFISRKNETNLTEDVICRIRMQSKSYLYVIQRDRGAKNKSDGILIAILSYQLRTMLSGMSDYSAVSVTGEKSINIDKLLSFMRSIVSSTENTISMLENLITYTSVQIGVREYKPVETSLNLIIEDVINDFRHYSMFRNIRIHHNQSNDIKCIADVNTLKIILRNLLDNAVQWHDDTRVDITSTINQGFIEISVTLNGSVIDNQKLRKLFSSELPDINPGGGTSLNLGLILSRTLIEQHGGRIWAESKKGKGLAITFTIPA
ncbi:MAG TPA: PAS domain-containing sensor histidine kinase [Bacteroidales bacterium]|nr:PAS domain-containing sensor histidine kinase [Bacteroidales bacterium]